MFNENVIVPPKTMGDIVPSYHSNISHWRQAADRDENLAAVLPGKPSENGRPREFTPLKVGLFMLLADLVTADFKTPLSAKIARRIMEAHQRQPEIEQWCVVHTANGNVSTLPYTEAGLETGYISGSRLTFGIVIDLKNYADRVSVAIAGAPRVIGGEDA